MMESAGQAEVSDAKKKDRCTVHLFIPVRVSVDDVPYESLESAIKQAEKVVEDTLADILTATQGDNAIGEVSYTNEVPLSALVDPLDDNGEVIYDKTVWVDDFESYQPMKGNISKQERARDAQRFMGELMSSFETLGGIGDEYGQEALVDIIYLQQAIQSGTHIDAIGDQVGIIEVIKRLPSADEWMKYIKIDRVSVPGKMKP